MDCRATQYSIKGPTLIGIAVVLACITFAVFIPTLQSSFLNWDDNRLIVENPNIRSIDSNLIKWAFTYATELWMPMTWLSFAIDYALWGLNSKGFHLTNIVFHAVNTGLVFLLTVKLIRCGTDITKRKALISGAVTALLFGIHPLRVGSVAWATERKDVLYSFFYLLSLFVYLRYVSAESKKSNYYLLSLILFVLSLMSKPMAITLPVILLILDFYPLGRFKLMTIKQVLLEKLPFFMLSFTLALITILAHPLKGGLQELDIYPFPVRIGLSVQAYIFYIFKMLLPFNLVPYYPHPFSMDIFSLKHIWPFMALATITSFAVWSVKKNKVFFSAWFYYIATLIPVTGMFQGAQVVADRYTYLPSLGIFLLAGLGVAVVFEKCSNKCRPVIIAVLILLSGILAGKTRAQAAFWHDSISLWSHEIDIYPKTASLPYYYRAEVYISSGYYRNAIKDLDKVIEFSPQHGKPSAKAYSNRGSIYYAIANYQKAVEDFNKSIEFDPLNPDVYYNRGNAYLNLGDYQKAIKDFNKTIEINPGDAEAYVKLKLASSKAGGR